MGVWWNGRHGRLKICWAERPVKVRLLSSPHMAEWWNGRHAGLRDQCREV